MLSLKLAYRNLIGAGLRTWLNVGVLSLIYVLIIWHQGFFLGMLEQVSRDAVKYEYAGGQYWNEKYDPYDLISLDESHALIPPGLSEMMRCNNTAPILITTAAIFPHGRMQMILLKGIDPGQTVLAIPSSRLNVQRDILPVLVGKRMAKKNSFHMGDSVTIRWRDSHGTFDAVQGEIVEIMETNVPTIDSGQLWIPLDNLRKMMRLEGEATIITVGRSVKNPPSLAGWVFRNDDYLLRDIRDLVATKSISASVLHALLLFLAVIAVFDTQVLSIFKRRKEIGTLMALGLTRIKVISIFTLEGLMNGLMALAVGAVYGIPLLVVTARKGIPLPQSTENYGFAISEKLFPSYPIGLVVSTVLIVMLTVTVVSYLPTREIAGMKPTEALKGKST
ncbi:MAG: ABC transporter permease [Candidatus Xenobiia bacterium LiM19]